MALQQRVERARRDDDLVVLEGVHALKHAVRFGADVLEVVSPDPHHLQRLLADLAPDVVLDTAIHAVESPQWSALTRGGLPSPSLAIARRGDDDVDTVLASAAPDAPVVALEQPTHLGNVGAVVRVAAAARAAAVVVTGTSDPWHPRAVRGGAGLQFALPVAARSSIGPTPRPIVAVDPRGVDLPEVQMPRNGVLVFGTERAGLADIVLDRAETTVRLPMAPGVSSLNLATSVAALLYGAGLITRN